MILYFQLTPDRLTVAANDYFDHLWDDSLMQSEHKQNNIKNWKISNWTKRFPYFLSFKMFKKKRIKTHFCMISFQQKRITSPKINKINYNISKPKCVHFIVLSLLEKVLAKWENSEYISFGLQFRMKESFWLMPRKHLLLNKFIVTIDQN